MRLGSIDSKRDIKTFNYSTITQRSREGAFFISYPFDSSQPDKRHRRHDYGDEDDIPESETASGNKDVDIHTVKACHESRDHKDDGQACHPFHDSVHIVGYDGGIGVESALENVAVDAYGAVGLTELYVDVLKQLFIERILIYFLDTFKHHYIALDRGVEKYERLLNVHEPDQIVILDAALEVFLRADHV